MSSSKDLQGFEPEQIKLITTADTRGRFTNATVNMIVLIMLIVAFIPSLLNPDFYGFTWRFVLSIVLGVLYGLIGTFGQMRLELVDTWPARLLYFSAQLAIVFALLSLGKETNNNYWLLMLPLCAQGLMMGWQGALGLSAIQLIGFWLIHAANASVANLVDAVISLASAMLFTILFTYIAVREGEARTQIERLATDLRRANHRLASYATQAEELATTRERNRLAREIHDNLGHYLTIVNVQIEAARTVMEKDPEKAADALSKAQRLTQEGLSSVRQSVSALRESPLGERPLSDAIHALATETEAAGLATTVTINGNIRPLDPKIELTLYRAVQESLTNVRKHAHATHTELTLDYNQTTHVDLIVQDNGRGAQETENGFGLLGLKERIQLLDGQLNIETTPGAGFALHISIPTSEE